jgi:Family of unknown function (DUF6318)
VRIKVALAAVATALAVSGSACSGDPEPTLTPTGQPTTAPPPTATTTPPPPTLPTTAQADSPAGAESFARYWLTALDYAYQTGNTTPFRSLGVCPSCAALANGIDRFYSSGGRIEGGAYKHVQAKTQQFSADTATVSLTYDREERTTIDGVGKRVAVPAEIAARMVFTLQRERTSWLVTKIQVAG